MNNENYTLSKAVTNEDHMQGNPKAPIVLVEYGDYQCPYCGEAYPIVKKLQQHFGDQLAFVFRNFPLSQMHIHAFHAAEAAELASDDDKFWPMHDSLYENQDNLGDAALVERAKKLGMNSEKFFADLEDNSKSERVKSDFMSGVESGVNGTPSFFINGEKYNGSWQYEDFKNTLQQLLG